VTAFGNRRKFENSSIGGIPDTQEMLDFCTANGIASDVEIISAEQINQAWDRVLASDVDSGSSSTCPPSPANPALRYRALSCLSED
jgi:hypothetical protein